MATGAMDRAIRRRHVCPYVEKGFAKCAAQLTLCNLSRAFSLCADCYKECKVYKDVREHALQRQLASAQRLLAVS
jgi:hypothetical protein